MPDNAHKSFDISRKPQFTGIHSKIHLSPHMLKNESPQNTRFATRSARGFLTQSDYVILYGAYRSIEFSPDFDELYWNVTENS